MAVKSKSNKIEIIRVYDAPVKIVWDAWHDPKQVGQWWGPRGFTLTTHSKDLRTGGTWHYTMHGPDGTDYINKTKYLEVEPYARMVYDHGGNDERAPLFRVTANFIDLKGKTRLEMSFELPTPEAAEETKKFIKKANGNSTWDRLGEFLTKELSGKEQFVINRTFEAPIATVREMWTNPKHLSKWMGPAGSEMELFRADIHVGGSIFYGMSFNGGKMHGRADNREVGADRIVYVQQFCDEHEKPARHPLASTWPMAMITVVR
ncbi:MAG: SRPBCC domain-containing protein, partial [Bacteriovoracia bacterium]